MSHPERPLPGFVISYLSMAICQRMKPSVHPHIRLVCWAQWISNGTDRNSDRAAMPYSQCAAQDSEQEMEWATNLPAIETNDR